jgi:hypothetical protein
MQSAAPLEHTMFAPIVQLDAPDLVRAWTDFATFAQGDASIGIASFATDHDAQVKQGGRWRIAHRTIVSPGEPPPAHVGPVLSS